MAKAEIFAGNCGYDTEVEATMDGKVVKLNIASECPAMQRMAEELNEVNPYNASSHPVIAIGRNTHIPEASFVGDLNAQSQIYCTDCHGNPQNQLQGNGPHAGGLHILRESSPYITVWNERQTPLSGAEVCFNCHRYETYANGTDPSEHTNFRREARNLHSAHAAHGSCYQCHDSHGSDQLHLLNLDASINNVQRDKLVT